MTQKLSLTDRIAGILQSECPSTDVRDAMTDAKAAMASVLTRRAEAEAVAIDPLANTKAVEAADASIAKIDLEQRRLTAAIEKLEAHLAERLSVERAADKLARFEQAEADRDAVIESIRTEYPAALDILIPLAQRIAASDAELDRVNADLPAGKTRLARAETIARGHKLGTPHPTIVANMKLPHVADSFYYAYPRVNGDGHVVLG